MRTVPLALGLAGSLLVAAPLARAQPGISRGQPHLPMKGAVKPPPPPPPPVDPTETVDSAAADRARRLMTEGARLHDEGKFAEAYVALVAAWAVKQTPSLAKNLADCEAAIGKHREAAGHLRYILQSADAKPDEKARAKHDLDDELKRIGTFRVTVSIDNADVLLDGEPIGKSPLKEEIYVVPGKHTFEARRDRYSPDKRDVEIPAGSALIVRLHPTVDLPPPDAPSTVDKVRPWIVRGGLALTVIGVGLGAGMAVLANHQAKDAAALRSMLGDKPVCAAPSAGTTQGLCDQLRSTGSRQSGYANASVGMFAVGGVAALITAGVWAGTVLTKNQPAWKPLTGLHLAPTFYAGAREGGAALTGSF